MKKQIVITRYDDNIDWMYKLKIPYLIYDKKQHMVIDEKENITYKDKLKDVCSWSHTMFFHIYNNYDKLADYTVFTKAIPWYIPGGWKTGQVDKGKFLDVVKQDKLPSKVVLCGQHNHSCDIKGKPGKFIYIEEYEKAMKELNKKLMKKKTSMKNYYYTPGGTMIVPKKFILSRDKKFYKGIVDMLESKETHLHRVNGSMYAHCIERLLIYIFKAEKNYIEL